MPAYDLSLVVKQARRPEIVSAVKRIGQHIINNDGYLRHIEFVGERKLPQKSWTHGMKHTFGNYFVLRIDLPIAQVPILNDHAKRDNFIIKYDVIGVVPPEEPKCTLEEEFLSPSERPSVQRMIQFGRQAPRTKRIYKPNTGLEIDPSWR